jgi:hypothetical protein
VLAIIGGALFARFLVRSPGAGLLWSRWEAPAAHFVSTHASPGDPIKDAHCNDSQRDNHPNPSKLAEPNCECPVSTKSHRLRSADQHLLAAQLTTNAAIRSPDWARATSMTSSLPKFN